MKCVLALVALLALLASETRAGSPSDWKSRTIYQVVTDRFALPPSLHNETKFLNGTDGPGMLPCACSSPSRVPTLTFLLWCVAKCRIVWPTATTAVALGLVWRRNCRTSRAWASTPFGSHRSSKTLSPTSTVFLLCFVLLTSLYSCSFVCLVRWLFD